MQIYTKESLIDTLKAIRSRGWIATARPNNDGGVGNTLEDLLGLKENNLPIPNAAEWELKAQKKETTSLLTLFHMEPSPQAFKFVPAILLPQLGWQHKEAGNQYPTSEKSFRQTICAQSYSNRGFRIQVDYSHQRITVEFNPNQIDRKIHPEWAESVAHQQLNPQPYWGFDDLFHKVGSKLHNCFYIRAESKKIDGKLHFHYQDIFMLKNLNRDHFIRAIESSYIYVDFDARTGHNHGTKFRIKSSHLIDLYGEVQSY